MSKPIPPSQWIALIAALGQVDAGLKPGDQDPKSSPLESLGARGGLRFKPDETKQPLPIKLSTRGSDPKSGSSE